MNIDVLKKRLLGKEIILMDGGTGTEILNRGVKTMLPLWSAKALLTRPEIVQQIHEDYIKAGAEIIITNTFSTTRRVFAKKGIGEKAKEATLLACQLARQAIDKVKPSWDVYVAGSVSPLEDCYSPKLTPPQKDLNKEHMEIALNFKESGIDFILAETMITLRETVAALEANKKVGFPVAVSFCCNDKLQLLGGDSLRTVIKQVEKFDPIFVGINCVTPLIATRTLVFLRTITNRPICVYAQGDGIPANDQGWKFDNKDKEEEYISAVKQWINDGAQIIGGCCGTTPTYIKNIRKTLFSF